VVIRVSVYPSPSPIPIPIPGHIPIAIPSPVPYPLTSAGGRALKFWAESKANRLAAVLSCVLICTRPSDQGLLAKNWFGPQSLLAFTSRASAFGCALNNANPLNALNAAAGSSSRFFRSDRKLRWRHVLFSICSTCESSHYVFHSSQI